MFILCLGTGDTPKRSLWLKGKNKSVTLYLGKQQHNLLEDLLWKVFRCPKKKQHKNRIEITSIKIINLINEITNHEINAS